MSAGFSSLSWSTPCSASYSISINGWRGHVQDGALVWLVSWFRLWALGLQDFLVGWWSGSKSKNPKRTRWDLYHFLFVLIYLFIYFARWHTGLPDLHHFLHGYLRSHRASLLQKPVQIQDMGRTPTPTSCGEKCRSHLKRSMGYGRSHVATVGKCQCTPTPS